MDLPYRIEKKIVRVPFCGCWIWIGSASARYGSVWDRSKVARAHRVVFRMTGRHLPDDRELLHSCDVPLCVNPDHLTVGTHAENMADMVTKGRGRAPTGDSHWTRSDRARARAIGRRNIAMSHGSGEANNNAKVTKAIAAEIRAAHEADPTLSMAELGARFGLAREQTRKIVKGIAWTS